MRKIDFMIFFSIAFTIYGLINFYIFIRGRQALAQTSSYKICYLIVFLFFFLSFIIGRFLERAYISWFSELLVWIGSFWIAFMVYFFLTILFIDILRLINHFISFFPAFITADYQKTKKITGLIVIGIVAVIVTSGFINTLYVGIRSFEFTIKKTGSKFKSLNIVLASDIHLGTILCKERLKRIIDKINGLDPDIVLLVGDIIDEDIAPVIRKDLGKVLQNIKSRLGVYGVTGNHEYIGGVEKACMYLEGQGIKMLRDSVVKIEDSFYLIGREDRSIRRFIGRERKDLEELMKDVDKSLPIILMDHQPFNLEESVRNGVDLQVSGHTHHGQLWPFNFITKRVYEVSWGDRKKGDTQIYVSCGAGTWGPPVRTVSRPEVVNIKLRIR